MGAMHGIGITADLNLAPFSPLPLDAPLSPLPLKTPVPLKPPLPGEWLMGFMHGIGTFESPDGSRYSGGWRKDVKHGLGKKVCVHLCALVATCAGSIRELLQYRICGTDVDC